MDPIVWSNISLAVWGDSPMAKAFVAKFRQRYPGVRIFDRHAELQRQATATHVLTHLEVADIDAVFYHQGHVEYVVLRCLDRHRSFNYVPGRQMQDKPRRDVLLRTMIDVIPRLLVRPPELEPETSAEEHADEVTQSPEETSKEEEKESAGS